MKKRLSICLLLVVCMLCGMLQLPANATNDGISCHTLAADVALDGADKKLDTAKAVILYELNTDTLVYGYNADKLVNPTGLVKLLTVLVALEKGNLEDIVTVKQSTLNTVAVGSVSARLKSGEEISLRDLLYCIMVSSANDACAVVAAHIGGNQAGFVTMMNEKARQLGCSSSNFTNAHGLTDEAQYSTARDLAIITKAALENPLFAQMFGMTTATVAATNKSDERSLKTTNNMMREDLRHYDSRVTGGKPAAATTSDRSMVCTAQVGAANYLCVVMNTKASVSEDGMVILRYGIFEEMSALLDYAQQGFEIRQILDDSQAMYQYAVAGGENGVVLRPSRDVSVLLPKDCDAEKLHFYHTVNMPTLTAPISQGQKLGQLTISYGNLIMGTCELLAMNAVAQDGSSITDAERLNVSQMEEASIWKQILSYAAFILLGGLAIVALVTAAIRGVRNAKIRSQQRRRARSRKRSR